MSEEDVKVGRPSCFCRCWGARCRYCGVWLTKHDHDAADALASALGETDHRCAP